MILAELALISDDRETEERDEGCTFSYSVSVVRDVPPAAHACIGSRMGW